LEQRHQTEAQLTTGLKQKEITAIVKVHKQWDVDAIGNRFG